MTEKMQMSSQKRFSVVSLDGHPVRHLDDLLGLLKGDLVGKVVPVRIVRGGQWQELEVTIGEREVEEAGKSEGGRRWRGHGHRR